MTCRATLAGLTQELGAAGVESPRIEAERLVSAALGVRRHEFLLDPDIQFGSEQVARLSGLVRRRMAGEPLQYIEGSAAFRTLELSVNPAVLVPRPETEQLVDHVAGWIQRDRAGLQVESALDVGTGSGALALALASERLARSVVAVDRSEPALSVAAGNVAALGLEDRIRLRHCGTDFWAAIEPQERFELIVSNPPYVTEAELGALPEVVGGHEPRVALAGGKDGLDVIRRLVAGAPDRLQPAGALFMEIGAGQGAAVYSLLKAEDRWSTIRVCQDLCERDRFAIAVRNG
ncbi:MAG: peptide chain release factor N(5)-glutamine methyltransferase [Gemmatimonadota bacterium]